MLINGLDWLMGSESYRCREKNLGISPWKNISRLADFGDAENPKHRADKAKAILKQVLITPVGWTVKPHVNVMAADACAASAATL